MVLETLHVKLDGANVRSSTVSPEDLTRNSNQFVRSLRPPPQQMRRQMRRYAITKNKTKDQSVN